MGFLWVNNKETFETVLESGLVDGNMIAFINDTKEIWTHGTFFGGERPTREEVSQMIGESITQVLNQDI